MSPKSVALTAVLLAGALLSGCGSPAPAEPTVAPTTAEPSAPTTEATTPAEPDPTPSVEPEPSTEPTTPAPANPDPLPEVTPPGTEVAIGESVVVQKFTTVQDMGMEQSSAYLEYTITAIEEGDPSIIDDLQDPGAYAGGTVYYLKGTVEVLAVVGELPEASSTGGAITGVQDDGQAMAHIFSFGRDYPCDGGFRVSELVVGHQDESCAIALAVPGASALGAIYYGDSTAVGANATSEDAYYNQPIVWLL